MELQDILDKIDNQELDTLSPKELDEAIAILADAPQFRAEYQAAVEFKMAQASAERPQISDVEFTRNAIELNRNDSQLMMDANFEDAINDKIEYVDENGEVEYIELSQEFVDAAKLGVAVSAIDEKEPLSQTEYSERVQQEIAKLLSSMIVVKPADENNENNIQDANERAQSVIDIFNPEFSGRVQIDKESAGAVFANYLGQVATRAQELNGKYGNHDFFVTLGEKFDDLDKRLENKLKDAYAKSKAVVNYMIETGSWKQVAASVALAGVASVGAGTAVGVGAAVGLTGLTAYRTYQRMNEFWKGFKKENQNSETRKQSFKNFGKYALNNKAKITEIVLYAGGTVAGADAAWNTYQAITQAGAGAAEVTAAASSAMGTKFAMITGAAATPYAADTTTALMKRDWKTAKSSAKKTATVIGVSLFASWAMGGSDAHAAEPTDPTIVPTDSLDADSTQVIPSDSTQVTQPVAEGGDTGDTGGTGDHTGDAAAVTHEYTTDEVGAREQHFYEKRLAIVPHSDQMVLNATVDANGDVLVKLPENMTPEQAVHLAAMEKLYYGNDEALKALLNCDDVQINTEQYFAQLHEKFVTEIGDPRGIMGYPTDPNYVADPNIHARITGVNCDDGASISRTVHHPAPAQQPVQPAQPDQPAVQVPAEEPVDELVVDYPAQPEPAPEVVIHTDGGQDTVEQLTAGNPDDVKIKLPAEEVVVHADGNGDVVNQLTGGNPEPVRVKLTPELMNAINSANQR